MKRTITLLTALMLAPLALPHAADKPKQPAQTGTVADDLVLNYHLMHPGGDRGSSYDFSLENEPYLHERAKLVVGTGGRDAVCGECFRRRAQAPRRVRAYETKSVEETEPVPAESRRFYLWSVKETVQRS